MVETSFLHNFAGDASGVALPRGLDMEDPHSLLSSVKVLSSSPTPSSPPPPPLPPPPVLLPSSSFSSHLAYRSTTGTCSILSRGVVQG